MKRGNNSKIAIIVLAFNEESTITNVIKEILNEIECEIIVTNDGSTDNTREVVEDLTKFYTNVHLLNHPINMGSGVAFQTAIRYAIIKGCKYFIQVDADGQHPPIEIKKVLSPVIENKADMVIGSRYLEKTNYKAGAIRRSGIWGTSKVITLLQETKITDINSGFRSFNIEIAKNILDDYDVKNANFKFTVRMLKKGYVVKEVPVSMEKRKFGTSEFTKRKLVEYPFRVIWNVVQTEF